MVERNIKDKDYTKTKRFAITTLVLSGVSIFVTISLEVLSFFLVKSVNNTIDSFNSNQEVVTIQPRDKSLKLTKIEYFDSEDI